MSLKSERMIYEDKAATDWQRKETCQDGRERGEKRPGKREEKDGPVSPIGHHRAANAKGLQQFGIYQI